MYHRGRGAVTARTTISLSLGVSSNSNSLRAVWGQLKNRDCELTQARGQAGQSALQFLGATQYRFRPASLCRAVLDEGLQLLKNSVLKPVNRSFELSAHRVPQLAQLHIFCLRVRSQNQFAAPPRNQARDRCSTDRK